MESDQRLSVYVSSALDCLGKSKDMAKFRVDQYKLLEQNVANSFHLNVEGITAGSKGEGLTSPFESDIDIMTVYNDVICGDDTSSLRHVNGVTVFESDRRYTSPGYTKLRLYRLRENDIQRNIKNSLIKGENSQFYLSSDFFIEPLKNNQWRPTEVTILDRSGPSIPAFPGNLSCWTNDRVIAFRCICPEMTQSFITRPRDYGWPSNDQLAEIATLDGHVVPVGYKGSETACLEWRICYTKAERFLMCSLNDTQTKLYILLKMVAKTYLNSTSKDITSYVLKNIVVWLAECCDIETFKEELLVIRLIQALVFLRKCIINNNLPSYMIPGRNLFSEKIDLAQRQKLIILLTELKHYGGVLLMGCERLRGTMVVLYNEPAIAEQYRCKRDMIEKLWLWQVKIYHKIVTKNGQLSNMLTGDDISQLCNTVVKVISLILPDYRSLQQQGHDRHNSQSMICIFNERLMQWLS